MRGSGIGIYGRGRGCVAGKLCVWERVRVTGIYIDTKTHCRCLRTRGKKHKTLNMKHGHMDTHGSLQNISSNLYTAHARQCTQRDTCTFSILLSVNRLYYSQIHTCVTFFFNFFGKQKLSVSLQIKLMLCGKGTHTLTRCKFVCSYINCINLNILILFKVFFVFFLIGKENKQQLYVYLSI